MAGYPQFLTLEEAAALARTAPSSVRRWIRDGRLRAAKPGRRVLIERTALLALLRGAPCEASHHDAPDLTET